MNADGSDQRNITNLPNSDDTDPQWSPDGSQIAFASTRYGREDIYVLNADGSNVRRLTNHPAVDADPTWSPDGTRIAFVSLRDGNVEIYVLDADSATAGSGNLQRLTQNSYNDFEIDWSPDGRHIAVASQRGAYGNIYLIDVHEALQNPGGDERQQLTDTDAHDAFPSWSPDGSQIAFISDREGAENWEIYVMDADGGNQRRLTFTDAIEGPPSWSPDGTQLAFESNRDGDFEIYVMAVDGTQVRRLTHNSVPDRNPDWRPEPSTTSPSLCLAVAIDTCLRSLEEKVTSSGAALVAREGQVLLSRGYGLADRDENAPNAPQTRSRLDSITKQLTMAATITTWTTSHADGIIHEKEAR